MISRSLDTLGDVCQHAGEFFVSPIIWQNFPPKSNKFPYYNSGVTRQSAAGGELLKYPPPIVKILQEKKKKKTDFTGLFLVKYTDIACKLQTSFYSEICCKNIL